MLTKLKFAPGINRDTTSYTNQGGWFDSNLIRFRNGLPEKIGGWARVYTSQTALSGVCRKMFGWTSLVGTEYTALPTNVRFYVDNSTSITDITPLRRQIALSSSPLATTNGSAVIKITDDNHGAVVGDEVILSGASAVGGISSAVLNAANGYEITSILNENQYTITVSANATSTATGGGTVTLNYLYHKGAASQVSFAGWGSGPWGGASSPLGTFTANNPITTATSTNTTVGGIARTVITVDVGATHGATAGDWFYFTGASAVGGVPAYYLSHMLKVLTTPTASTLTAEVVGTATSNATGGGTGVVITIYAQTGNYGFGYGPETTVTTYNSGLWSVDNYGEDLVACPRDSVESATLGQNTISVTNASTTVEVTQPNHGYETGMAIILAGAPAVGGIPALDINGTHTITVIDDDSYSFVADSAATSTSTGGGTSMKVYLSTLTYWDVGSTRATSFSRLGSAYAKKYMPYTATEVLVSDINRHVIALGCNTFDTTGGVDKMLVRFSDSNDPTNWDASDTTKTAGELRCSAGSYIVTGLHNREEILIWTDTALYTMTYVGAPYTYGLQLVGTGFDIIGPNSKTAIGAAAYWMGLNNFYTYNGAVAPLPCPVRDYVFNDINRQAGFKVYCSMDSGNNEIIWFYPSSSSQENDRYVAFNYVEGLWYYGQLGRTAWMDRGQYENPRAMATDGYLYNHEFGSDDGSVSPAQPLNAYIQSSPIEIAEGDNYVFVSRIIPDLTFRNTSLSLGTEPVVKFTVKTQDFPGGETYPGDTRSARRGAQATLTVDRFTNQVYTRLRARSVMLRVSSDGLGVNWRLGTPRIDMRQDGRK